MKRINLTKCIIAFFTLFSMFSCSLQSKVRTLKEYKIEKIGLRYDSLLYLPGSSHKIGLVIFTQDQRLFRTTGLLNGSLFWKNFKIEAENAKFSNGTLEIDKVSETEKLVFIPIKIVSKYEPNRVFYDTIQMNYETGVQIFPTKDYLKSPGAKINFGLQIRYDNDRVVTVRNSYFLKKVLPNYNIFVKGGYYDNASFTISSSIFDNPDHTPGFMLELKKDSNVYDTFDIRMNYIDVYKVSGNGSSGIWGSSGSSGSTGSTGNHGSSGYDGYNGSDGNRGDDIDVYTDIYFDSILKHNLIKIHTSNLKTRQHRYFLLNPNGGGFNLYANGGSGGSGGDGGSGGNGGSGYNGEYYYEYIKEIIIKKDTAGKEIKEEIIRKIERQKPGGNGGSGGHGGYGGLGGYGGDGGHVIVYHTAAMRNYLKILKINVSGGNGGMRGIGGSGGSGGSGGNGNPKGINGNNGMNGRDGNSGYDGSTGVIEYITVKNIDW